MDMTIEDLADLLRANAKGLYPVEAATELLIRSDVWLRQPAFRDACVEVWGPTTDHPHAEAGAYINWDVVGKALTNYAAGESVPEWFGVCSGGERRLIQIAHDIAAGPMVEVSGLDRGNVALVLAAVSHSAGTHEHVDTVFVVDADGVPHHEVATPENSGPLFPWPWLS